MASKIRQLAQYPQVFSVYSGNTTLVTKNLISTSNIEFDSILVSKITTGNTPFLISSNTLVANLNVELLNGQYGSYYASVESLSNHSSNTNLHLTSNQNIWIDSITATSNEINFLVGVTSNIQSQLNNKEPTISSGNTSQYYCGDKTWQLLDKSSVGLSNVENTALSTWTGSTNLTTVGDLNANSLFVSGDFTVNGNTTVINATTLTIKDKNIELANTSTPTDPPINGSGGITLKGTTDKTIIWNMEGAPGAVGRWTSSENWNLLSGRSYKINANVVLNETSLGSSVISSNLTSLGTLTSLSTSGTINYSSLNSGNAVTGLVVINPIDTHIANTESRIELIPNNAGIGIRSVQLGAISTGQFASDFVIRVSAFNNPIEFFRLKSFGELNLSAGISSSNSTTGTLTVSGGTGITGNLNVAGNIKSSSEIISTDGYAFRAVQGNYGSIFYNDGYHCYLLQTASGDQYGTINSYRPFYWNLSTGTVGIDGTGQGTSFGGSVHIQDNQILYLGTGYDFQFVHDGTNSGINNLNGALFLTSNNIILQTFGTSGSNIELYQNSLIIDSTETYFRSQDGLTNFAKFDSAGLSLLNPTSNLLHYNNVGVNPPTVSTRSPGTKIVLYPNVGVSSVDYAIGIDSGTLWNSVATSGNYFKWYAGQSNIATLDGYGNLTTVGNITSTNSITSTDRMYPLNGIGIATKDDISTRINSGFWQTAIANTANGWPVTTNSWYHLISATHSNDTNYFSMQFACDFFDANQLYYRTTSNNGSNTWYKMWHSGNDGVDSGLDADLLDGQHGSYYTVAITNDTSTNTVIYPTMSSASSGNWNTAYTSSSKLYFNPSTGTLSATIFSTLSDKNLKENINSINNASYLINSINPVEFNWKDSGKKSYGVIAQEIEKILPELVVEQQDRKSVEYQALIAILIKSQQEMQKEILDLKEKITNLENRS